MDVVVKALVLVAIVASGYGVKRVGWLQAADFRVLATVALRVTLPCALAVSFNSFDVTPDLVVLPFVGFGLNMLLLGAGAWVGGRLGDRAFGIFNVPSFNIGLFAIPYVSTFVGKDAIVHAAMFDVGNSLAAAGVAYGIGTALARGERLTFGRLTRTMFTSPILVPYLVLVGMRVLGLHLPGPVHQFAEVVGGANTFLAMFMIGVGLEIVLPRHKYATAAGLLVTRYAVATLFVVGVWFVPGLDPAMKIVLGMLAFAPIAAMVAAFVGEVGGDVETATFMSSASIIVGIVAMPVVLGVLTALSG